MDSTDKFREYIHETADRLEGPSDDAWHSLVECGRAALPHIVDAYRATRDLDKKLALISVVAEYRTHEALDFLGAALASREDQIWKSALDGLVMLGGESARDVLRRAAQSADSTKLEWIAEALSQIETSAEDRRS